MNIGFDLIFLGIIAGSTIVCFLLGEEKSQRMMVGVSVGGLVANIVAPLLVKYLPPGMPDNAGVINVGLMVVCAGVIMVGRNVRDSKWPKSKLKAIVAGFLAGIGGLSLAITSLPEATRTQLTNEYNLAALAYDLRLFTIIALLVWLLASYLTIGKARK